LGWPTNGATIQSLGQSAGLLDGKIRKIELLGSRGKIKWKQTAGALVLAQPKTQPNDFAMVYKITVK